MAEDGETPREKEIREKRVQYQAAIRTRIHGAVSAWLDLIFASYPSHDEPLQRGFRILVDEADYTWTCVTEASQREEL